ncbi:hypothetical protein GCM10009809_09910 [Isoptericola hypogeus]|uniref:Uncharacterized protein n=1 Tax=Isoptericola hypogeus TaxID=300179 RepID=A0ABP4V0Y1_9MICO
MPDDATRMPWQEAEVFAFPERAGWVFWAAGLNPAGWGDVAAEVPGGENDDAVIAAVRAVDERATADGRAWGAGIWCPEKNDHRPTASLLLRTFGDRGDPHKAFKKAVKQGRKVPRLGGVTISGYSCEGVETESGPMLVQLLDSTDAETGVLLHTWRITLFPVVKDEVVEIECDTPFPHLMDDVDEELTALVQGSVYSIAEDGE